ncbi:UMP kinase [Candidatus Parcubacteria bacterium]|nr:UMP kinase [Candidatus Parcubacteria bacterium]
MAKIKFKKRIVIKTSGEVMGDPNSESNLDFVKIKKLAQSLKKLTSSGYQVAIVVGAGNIFRGRMAKDAQIERVTADHMGMIATHINALALQSMLEKNGQEAVVMSPFYMPKALVPYNHHKAIKHLESGKIVILAGGTGSPYFTTDTNMVLRALEIQADHMFKATNVAGVYDADPDKNPKAKLYKELTYSQALDKNLKVMDTAAFALARDNNLKLTVFEYSPANLIKVVKQDNIGTKVFNESH